MNEKALLQLLLFSSLLVDFDKNPLKANARQTTATKKNQ